MLQDRGSKECVEADHRLRFSFCFYRSGQVGNISISLMLAVRWKYRSLMTIRQPKPLPSIIMPSHINIPLLPSLPRRQTTYIFGIASRSFSDKIRLDRLTLDHDGLHMTGLPKRFDQPAWEFSRGLLSHKLTLATFEDNKIRSAELTSESDKFIHILYGVFYS